MSNSDNLVVTVLGIKKAHFDKDGEDIKYARLYGAFKEKSVIGQCAQELKIEYKLADTLKKVIGKTISVTFNRFGKVSGYRLIKIDDSQTDSDIEDEDETDLDDGLDDDDYPFPADDEK